MPVPIVDLPTVAAGLKAVVNGSTVGDLTRGAKLALQNIKNGSGVKAATTAVSKTLNTTVSTTQIKAAAAEILKGK